MLHGSAGTCTAAQNDTCTYQCDEGFQCSPECDATPCAANCDRTCSGGAFATPLECSAKPCSAADPPVLGDHMRLGDCTDVLISGEKCNPKCDDGYDLTQTTPCGFTSHSCTGESAATSCFCCYEGGWNSLSCQAKSCTSLEVATAAGTIAHINADGAKLPACTKASLSDGAVCSLSGACASGYSASTAPDPIQVTCNLGVATASGTCTPSPCNGVNTNFPHGNRGDCPASGNMGSGSRCTPVCDSGYKLDGDKTCNQGTVHKGQCRPVTCNATGIGRDKEPSFGRKSDGTCTDALLSGASCKPECAAGFSPHGSTNCTLGNITSVGFCATPKPDLKKFGCSTVANGTTTKWVCPESRSAVRVFLYLGLVGIFSLGCCGTWKMASAKISKAEYEAQRGDWSRVE